MTSIGIHSFLSFAARIMSILQLEFFRLQIQRDVEFQVPVLHRWTRSGDTPSAETDRLLQNLAITLQRENARAVLRLVPLDVGEASSFPDP